MPINKLSPDELNGLLGQVKAEGTNDTLSKLEEEALTELLNVSLGGSSTVLSTMFSEQVTVTSPELSIKQKDGLLPDAHSPFFVGLGEYTGGISGIQILSISKEDVQTITKRVDPTSDAEDTDKQFQIIQEVVQQMFASVSQSMSTVLELEVAHSLSGMDVIETQADFPVAMFTEEEWFAEASFQLKIGTQENVKFHLCIPVRLAKQMVGILTDTTDEDYLEETQEMQFQSNNQSNETSKSKDSNQEHNIQSVQFSSFDETASTHSEPNNLNMLLDIPLQVTVELGRTKRMVKEILEVSHGSIIELDKLAGEPVDILINNKLIAVGEVVVIDENFGVRVTDILSTADRISKLR